MRRFEGRVAVVSGAAQGIGKAVALRLGEEGATVIAVDINGEGAAATAQEIGGESLGQCNATSAIRTRCRSCLRRSPRKRGKLDVLVNVAAIVPFVKWDELTFEEWRRVMRVNLDGLYLMCRAGSDLMRAGRLRPDRQFQLELDLRRHAQHGALRRLEGRRAHLHPRTRHRARSLQDHRQFDLPGPDRYRGRASRPRTRTPSTSSKCCKPSRAAACPRTSCRPSPFSPRRRRTGSPARHSTSMPAWCAGSAHARRRQE